MFLKKNSRKLIYITLSLIIFLFIFAGCSLTGRITGKAGSDGSENAEKQFPSFSGSNIEFIDVNGGDTYPGEDLTVNINIVNSGEAEAKNVKVNLITDDFFISDNEETCRVIDSLEAGSKIDFKTDLTLIDTITEDTQVSCRLEISSGEADYFVGADYSVLVYGVRLFEGNFIPIIGLHAIEDHIEEPIELYTGHFDKLCSTLKDYDYETITFTDLLNYVDFGRVLPERPVIMTSDDGFQDVYTNAFPILKKYGYKMTVFLVTGAVGNTEDERKMNTYFNKRTSAVRPILTWPEIEEMHEHGCEFLSHTVNHVRLGLASDEEFLYELKQSKEDIESHLGNEVLFYAWPYDNNSPAKWHLIPEAGYRGAVRYGTGIEDMRTINLFDIKRVEFNSYIPPHQYAGYLNLDRSIEIEYKVDSEYVADKYITGAGETFTVEYIIKNTGEDNAKISSFELELPDNIELKGVDAEGSVNHYPGISEGVYMWVSDSYTVPGGGEINLILELGGIEPGESIIEFRITCRDNYVNGDNIVMEIKSRDEKA
ncbi:MAG: polysaccharide deacetylase family protein [Actinomycetota bacterium]|nr:polysaccharide deacetylase family protein [Actinomycetota bacterium]